MSQNDLVIANQTFPATRADINNALQALGSLNSGATAPATTYANMLWYDTGTKTLKMRAEANDQWISVGYLDQSVDAFRIFDDTQVVNASGTQTGLIGDQATATWEAGTATTESLVSPAKVKAAGVASFTDQEQQIGVGQTWQNVSGARSSGVWYQNTTGKPIQLFVKQIEGGDTIRIGVSTVTYATMNNSDFDSDLDNGAFWIVPTNHYYYLTTVKRDWFELR